MNYETRSYSTLVSDGNLISHPLPHGIPAKYEQWVKGRGAHMAPALIARTSEILGANNDSVLKNSVELATDFHAALGVDYQIIDPENIDKFCGSAKSIFLYRNGEDIESEFKNKNINMVVNDLKFSELGKEILHVDSKGITTTQDLVSKDSVYGIPKAPGAVCNSKAEMYRMIDLFVKSDRSFILKDPKGTDGNGITTDPSEVGQFPVIIEQKLDLDHTISVQYVNGVLGVLRENDKPDGDKRWKGNEMPYHNTQFVQELESYAEQFRSYISDITGEDLVIFGLDFGVYRDLEGKTKLALLDPNMRMPGNIPLYYQTEMFKKHGIANKCAEIDLLYEEDVPKTSGRKLQEILDQSGIGLLKYKESGIEIRKDKTGKAEGIVVLVQDPGLGGDSTLTMINIFGDSEKRIAELRSKFGQLTKAINSGL